MITTKSARVVFAALLLAGCNADSDSRRAHGEALGERPQEQRECWGSANPRNVQVCAVNFDEIVNNPDRFDGSYIKVLGYAAVANGYTYLYPSKDHFTFSAARGGIDISLSGEPKQKFEGLAESNKQATAVIGRFDAWRGRLNGSVGTISGDNIIFFEEGLPWESPQPPPPPPSPAE